jgi:hypothetical protein
MQLTKSPPTTAVPRGMPKVSAAACTLQFWRAPSSDGAKSDDLCHSSWEAGCGLAVLQAPSAPTSRETERPRQRLRHGARYQPGSRRVQDRHLRRLVPFDGLIRDRIWAAAFPPGSVESPLTYDKFRNQTLVADDRVVRERRHRPAEPTCDSGLRRAGQCLDQVCAAVGLREGPGPVQAALYVERGEKRGRRRAAVVMRAARGDQPVSEVDPHARAH